MLGTCLEEFSWYPSLKLAKLGDYIILVDDNHIVLVGMTILVKFLC